MSIWAGLDKKAFQASVQQLFAEEGGRNLSKSTFNPPWLPHEQRGAVCQWIPYKTRYKISKDFAFLAACEASAERVSAATFSRSVDSSRTVLSIAANEGIEKSVEDTFDFLVATLKRCASRGISERDCGRLCLRQVIRLHKNRILGRLGAEGYILPQHARLGKPIKVEAQLHRALSKLQFANGDRRDKAVLVAQIERLANTFDSLHQRKSGMDIDTLLEQVSEEAHDLFVDGRVFSLNARLHKMGLAAQIVQGRAARQLRAIGNYWRICQYLARASRTYHRAFETLELNTVRFGSKQNIVHAEVQLLLFHETSNDIVRPELMPASKKTCFLCHTFFESFGQYALAETHGQVPKRWSLPNDQRFDAPLRVKLNQALKMTSDVVQDALKKKTKKKSQSNPMNGPPNPAQSVVSSNLDKLQTPSISTIRPEASVIEISSMAQEKDLAAEICAPPSMDFESRSHASFEKMVSAEARTAEVLDCVEESAYCTTPPSLLERVGAEKPSAHELKMRHDSATSFKTSTQQLVQADRAIFQLDLDWLSLYISLAEPEEPLEEVEPSTRLCNAIRQPVPVSARPDTMMTVDVTELTSQDELTVEKPMGAKYFDLRMRLEGHEDVCVRLEWTE